MINITVIEPDGQKRQLMIPNGMGINLMEFLKYYDCGIAPVCGGRGRCGGCSVRVVDAKSQIKPSEKESESLDRLKLTGHRLSCQIQTTGEIDGLLLEVVGES